MTRVLHVLNCIVFPQVQHYYCNCPYNISYTNQIMHMMQTIQVKDYWDSLLLVYRLQKQISEKYRKNSQWNSIENQRINFHGKLTLLRCETTVLIQMNWTLFDEIPRLCEIPATWIVVRAFSAFNTTQRICWRIVRIWIF